MDNCEHKSIILDNLSDFLNKIDVMPCHPKIKLLLYHRYILSKLSWHLTIADLNKTWAVENLDTVFTRYIRKWFELPISASISGLIISRSYYGLNLVLASTKFIQCQTIIRNALKYSPNADIRSLWQASNTSTNFQYDQYRNAKQVLKSIQTQHHHRITEELTSQGLITTPILKHVPLNTTSLWSNVQKICPKISYASH